MTERRIDLNLNMPAFTSGEPGGGAGTPGGQADEGDRQRFRDHLNRADAPAPAPAPPAQPSPFSLLGAARPSVAAAPALPPLGELLTGLMIGEGHAGAVRMELADDLLPGVSVSVGEAGGAWQVDFICRDDDSRLRLNRGAPALAQEMADRLQRDTLWRVMTDDDEDLRLFETRATPGTPTR